MVISHNSQLGLRFRDNAVKVVYLQLLKQVHELELTKVQSNIKKVKELEINESNVELSAEELQKLEFEVPYIENDDVRKQITATIEKELLGNVNHLIDEKNNTYYFICDSVYKAAELIRIKENFTSRTLKDIKFGMYTYLMGKNRMLRFLCTKGIIKGFYFDDKNNIAFEWGCFMENGTYFFPKIHQKEFSTIMQVLTFVELGDIDIKILEGGRNNGKAKKDGKICNTSNKTVFVVDSSWNTIIMRTTGFAVRGHFRLQPCGELHKDRKLMWINAFEKHGYTRKPKAEIAPTAEA